MPNANVNLSILAALLFFMVRIGHSHDEGGTGVHHKKTSAFERSTCRYPKNRAKLLLQNVSNLCLCKHQEMQRSYL